LANRIYQTKVRFRIQHENKNGLIGDAGDPSKSAIHIDSFQIKGLVDAVQSAGRILRDFDDAVARLSDDAQDKQLMATYPNHLRDIAPVFKINPQKELEIIANKYRLQAQQMTNNAIGRLSQMNGKIKSLTNLSPANRSLSVTGGTRKSQQILGESAIVGETTLNGKASLSRGANADFFNRVPGANL
jgi:hypothetical protein